ncbi:MAG: PHP domain-containing protein [Candidatus Diapherotrites archaeon]|nr:PHP domain-containing protein [Candidatus Diapherotrites archaeon]
MIDLHMHSSASDGLFSPEQIVDFALQKGLSAIALTDHDSLGGIEAAVRYAKGKNLEVVSGIEINCDEEKVGFKEIEVVGLFVDTENKALLEFVEKAERDRLLQKKKIIEKLQKLGFEITFEELRELAKGAIGRPHIAALLVSKYPERIPSIRSAFEGYLGVGKPAYVDRVQKPGVKQAISVILKSGGLPFLAHPGVFEKKDSVKAIEFFQSQGGLGIETYYPYNIICKRKGLSGQQNSELIRFYQKKAKELGLLESGGSDFHGGDRDTMGMVQIPDTVLEKLKFALKNRGR